MTEREVLALLRQRFSGPYGSIEASRYVFATHVRSEAGFYAKNEFDAVVVDTWESKGLTIEIIEVKVSRSDWLNELKKPHKTQAALNRSNLFSIAAPKGVVKDGELKDGWGFYEVGATGVLRCKQVPKLHTPSSQRRERGSDNLMSPKNWESLPRSFVVALLRAIKRTADNNAHRAQAELTKAQAALPSEARND